MKEIWRNIVDYEGLYQVSNFGRVKSLWFGQERILKPRKDKGKEGYLFVSLYKEGKQKHWKVHRLVGMAFPDMVDWIEKAKGRPFEELEINHKDQNKENNFVENLEWCDRPYNNNYGTHNERVAKANSKTVYQYTLDGKFVREWSSTQEVKRQTGWSRGNIAACCRGDKHFKSAYGFRWSYTPQENT